MLDQETNSQPYGNAGCIVRNNDHILVVKLRETGKWDIPAGKPLPNEIASQTAERETWEETGVRVKVTRLLAFTSAPKEGSLYVYEAVPVEEMLPLDTLLKVNQKSSKEIVEARFLPITSLNRCLIPNNYGYISSKLIKDKKGVKKLWDNYYINAPQQQRKLVDKFSYQKKV